MKLILKAILIFGIISFKLHAQQIEIANYKIDVNFEPEKKQISGFEILTFKNTSNKTVKSLQFHTYLNAFKNENSSYIKEGNSREFKGNFDKSSKYNWGFIEIKKIEFKSKILTYKFIQPDDANKADETVIEILLPETVKPNESISIKIDFISHLPKLQARTGWDYNDYFLIAQWFPKIGVLEKNGSWNCHQFHEHTEFYADFGNYEVNFTAPKRFKIAHTGLISNTLLLKNSLIKYTFKARNVHDFALAASPHFLEYTEKYKNIQLKAFMMPEHTAQKDRYFKSVKKSIDYMTANVGIYPHPVISMIDPPNYASESSGMEYPMLITCGSAWGIGEGMKFQEIVTIHEFVHQYFQGMLASNEFENSWMDEGFTQYFEGKIMDYAYDGNQFDFLGLNINDLKSSRNGYVSMKFPDISEMRRNAWLYPKGTYGVLSYQKPATILKTLENYVGEKTLLLIIQDYYKNWKFKHPQPQDFVTSVQNIVGNKYDTFLQQAIYSSKYCDFGIKNLNENSFKIFKKGDLELSSQFKVYFKNGDSQVFELPAKLTEKSFIFKNEISKVEIDPEHKNWMDLDFSNNAISVEKPDLFLSKYTSKFIFWIQNLMV